MTTASDSRILVPALLSIAAVAGLGALNLNYPFVADQVIAHLGGRTVAEGGKLYIHFWDNKLPGLFWFHALAGQLFGFTEFGLHCLELIWMLVFSVVLIVALRGWLYVPWLSVFGPLAVVGTYYASADPFHMTQVEALIGLPLLACVWSACRAAEGHWPVRFGLLCSGFCAGICVVFKIVFAPLIALFWLAIIAHLWFREASSVRTLVITACLPLALGLGLVLGSVAIYFWRIGALDELYWTAFVYPPIALKAAPSATWLRLSEAVLYFSAYFLPWMFFIAAAVAHWWLRGRDLFTSLLIIWLLAGIGLILIQRFSWWPYHFLILFTPAGILGVRGCDVIANHFRVQGQLNAPAANALCLALVLAPCTTLAVPVEQKIQAHIDIFIRGKKDASELRRYVNPHYAEVERSVRFLATDQARPGPIYVFGDPLYYLLSGRRPALPIAGWPWEYFLQSQWVHLPRQLAKVKPPYIYLNNKDRDVMIGRGGGVFEFINEYYVRVNADSAGTWYQIRRDKLHEEAAPVEGT